MGTHTWCSSRRVGLLPNKYVGFEFMGFTHSKPTYCQMPICRIFTCGPPNIEQTSDKYRRRKRERSRWMNWGWLPWVTPLMWLSLWQRAWRLTGLVTRMQTLGLLTGHSLLHFAVLKIDSFICSTNSVWLNSCLLIDLFSVAICLLVWACNGGGSLVSPPNRNGDSTHSKLEKCRWLCMIIYITFVCGRSLAEGCSGYFEWRFWSRWPLERSKSQAPLAFIRCLGCALSRVHSRQFLEFFSDDVPLAGSIPANVGKIATIQTDYVETLGRTVFSPWSLVRRL